MTRTEPAGPDPAPWPKRRTFTSEYSCGSSPSTTPRQVREGHGPAPRAALSLACQGVAGRMRAIRDEKARLEVQLLRLMYRPCQTAWKL